MMTKIQFSKPLTSAYSKEVPTVIREYDTSAVNERINTIRSTFQSLTDSVKRLEAQINLANREFESRVREAAMEIVRGFALTDESMIRDRLGRFFDDVADMFQSDETVTLVVNSQTSELLPHLLLPEGETPRIEIDSSMENGECRIELGEQGLLMSLDAQLNAIRSQISKRSQEQSH